MTSYFFAADLHGHEDRYRALFATIAAERPAAVFLGGDLLPSGLAAFSGSQSQDRDFIADFLVPGFLELRARLAEAYPPVFLILGNDDARSEEAPILEAAAQGVWQYAHPRRLSLGDYDVYGYAYVPPTPFTLKDWERYDVSRFVDPGCVSPEEGRRTVPVAEEEARLATIREDLERLVAGQSLERAIFLFHAPPYDTPLDRAALDGKMVDHVPLDVHVGSIAIRRLIESHQPLVTLHGHVHEAARLSGTWQCRLGRTCAFTAAHDGPELALVRFDPADPAGASRQLIGRGAPPPSSPGGAPRP